MVLEYRSEDGVILAAGGIPRASLDQAAIDGIRLALNQNQPLGNSRFMSKIARTTGELRGSRPRGRPRKDAAAAGSARAKTVSAPRIKSAAGPL